MFIQKKFVLFAFLSMFWVLSHAQELTGAAKYSAVSNDSTRSITETNNKVPGVVGQTKTFYLKDGNVFNGVIKSIDANGNITLDADEGLLILPVTEILEETVYIIKKDGTSLQGKLLGESELTVLISNKYGRFEVPKSKIEKMERFFGGQAESRLAKKKFFTGAEQITALFLDPTAFVLQPYTFYITGLSMGYGFTEKMQLFSRLPNNFAGDINLSPRYVLYQRSKGAERVNIAMGLSLFSNHDMNSEYAKYYDDLVIDENDNLSKKEVLEKLYGKKNEKFFWEAYWVYGHRIPLASGRGNWSYHAGLVTNQLLFEKPKTEINDVYHQKFSGGFTGNRFKAYRTFFGVDYDLTRRIKFISEIFYDPSNRYLSFGESMDEYTSNGFTNPNLEGKRKEIDFDFGLTFAPNETLRLGLHFQQPFLTIYWKFLDY